jgi:hypothetical protein
VTPARYEHAPLPDAEGFFALSWSGFFSRRLGKRPLPWPCFCLLEALSRSVSEAVPAFDLAKWHVLYTLTLPDRVESHCRTLLRGGGEARVDKCVVVDRCVVADLTAPHVTGKEDTAVAWLAKSRSAVNRIGI